MEAAIRNGQFIENAEFSGNLYGTRYVIWALFFREFLIKDEKRAEYNL